MNIGSLKGIGEKTEKIFNKIGVETTEDIIEYFPRTYDIFNLPVPIREVISGSICTIEGVIVKKADVKRVRNLQVVTTYIQDTDGDAIKATWFNMPFLRNTLKFNRRYIFRGKISCNGSMYGIEHPQIYTPEEYYKKAEEMQPIYPLTAGLNNNLIKKCVKQALESIDLQTDYMPEALKNAYNLADRSFALHNIHFPKNSEDLYKARRRLVFDEFFLFIMVLKNLKEEKESGRNGYVMSEKDEIDTLISHLPYCLTDAQTRTWNEIKKDMCGEKLMNRLVQGDVGSGKTIIAFFALIMTALNGYQGAMMAPTEVLARQHYETLISLLDKNDIDITPVLLTGSMTEKQKRGAYEKISFGESRIIIGTHALIQEKVQYENLALVVTDEQHRFGVKQREALGEKGAKPHVIVMSATPIPRTLAIILYGDLDVSLIDELPEGRLPVKNCVVGTDYRPNAYRFIEREVEKGRQAYVICPMVEESEAVEGQNVIDYAETLKSIFPSHINVQYMHGKMKPSEKNDIMEKFSKNEIKVLVSTTVVEVGVNVPNATVMMIENAEKFGLAGLHQLRGRVGRGNEQSYCILINTSDKPEAKERLEILTKSNDGFFIANEDLRIRGPGDFFGVRQSGEIEFKLGDVISDAKVIKAASDAANMYAGDIIEIPDDERHNLERKIKEYTLKRQNNINI